MYVGGGSDVTYFDSFVVERIQKEIKTFIGRPSFIKTNIFRKQAYDSILRGYFYIAFIDFMLARKTLTEFTYLFSPNNFIKKWRYNFKLFYDQRLKMAGCNSHETPIMNPNLNATPSNEQQFRLNIINEIKYYFVAEIKERELMSKWLSKYIPSFDYFDKSLIVLSVTTGSISIALFATVIGAPEGMMSASYSLAFSITTGIVRKNIKNDKK